jgi:hypothetical protein
MTLIGRTVLEAVIFMAKIYVGNLPFTASEAEVRTPGGGRSGGGDGGGRW